MRPCRHCGHDRSSHIAKYKDDSHIVDDWDCIASNCDCHFFQGMPKQQTTGFLSKDKSVMLTQSERAILVHLVKQSDFADMFELLEKLK